MNAFEQPRKPSKRVQAAARAGQIRRQRLAEAREREIRIEETVVDILAARLAIEEAQAQIADGIWRLKALGETHDSIAALCEVTSHQVRSALAAPESAQSGAGHRAAAAGRTGRDDV